jgi:YD repeat-containing protein
MSRRKILCALPVFLAAAIPAHACLAPLIALLVTLINIGAVNPNDTITFTVAASATSYDGSGGDGPVTLSAVATGHLMVLGATFNKTYGSGQTGQITVTAKPTGMGAQSGTITFNFSCGSYPLSNPPSVTYNYFGGVPPVPVTFNNTASPSSGHPISSATGELFGFDEHDDLDEGGPLKLALQRYSASYLGVNKIVSALGVNWMHNFDVRLAATATSATVTLFRGKTVTFTRSGGAWQVSGNERYTYQLVSAGTGYQFLDAQSNLIDSFDSTGALIKVEDRNGNALTVTQTAGGAGPAQVADGLGRTLTFTYTGANLTRVADQAGRSVAFEYNGGNLAAVTDANGRKTTYTYTTAATLTGLITAETRPNGNQAFAQQFDAQGRVSRQTDSLGNTMTLVYNATSTTRTEPQGVTFTDTFDQNLNFTNEAYAAGAASQYGFDASKRLTGVTDRTGAKSSITYDAASLLPATYTDALGNVTSFRYAAAPQGGFTFYDMQGMTLPDGSTIAFARDARGNVTSLTDPSGRAWQSTWNSRGQPLTFTNPAGGVTTLTYGGDGNVASVQTPSGDTTKLAWDTASRLNLITTPDAATRATQYDSTGNITQLTDPRGNATNFSYDGNGNLTKITDPLGNSSAITYDGNDRVLSRTNPLGKTARRAFDTVSRVSSTNDASGIATTYSYNTQNQLTAVSDGAGNAWSITNDAESRVTGVTDPLNRTTTITRNARGEVTAVTTPNNEKFTRSLDAMGRVTSATDAAGRVTGYRYDSRGSLLSVTRPDGTVEAVERNELGLETSWTDANGSTWKRIYDKSGRLTSTIDPLGRVWTYTYDSRQRVASATFPTGSVTYTYDGSGNRTRVAYSDGTTLNYTYDALNRLTGADGLSIQYDAAGRINKYNGIDITRDDAGRTASVTYGPGKVARYTYNSAGLLSQLDDWAGGKTVLTYDAAHQLTSKAFASGVREDYTYDADSRPVTLKVTQGNKIIFNETVRRDALGRITSDDISGIAAPDPSSYISQQFDAAGQSYAATYDELGRMISDGLRTYKWDLAGRMTSYSGVGGSASFTYDGLGRVISRKSLPSTLQGTGTARSQPRDGEPPDTNLSYLGNSVFLPDGLIPLGFAAGQAKPAGRLNGAPDTPPIAAVGADGSPLGITSSIGQNFVFLTNPAAITGFLFLPPAGGAPVISGLMPPVLGSNYFDPSGINYWVGGGPFNTQLEVAADPTEIDRNVLLPDTFPDEPAASPVPVPIIRGGVFTFAGNEDDDDNDDNNILVRGLLRPTRIVDSVTFTGTINGDRRTPSSVGPPLLPKTYSDIDAKMLLTFAYRLPTASTGGPAGTKSLAEIFLPPQTVGIDRTDPNHLLELFAKFVF